MNEIPRNERVATRLRKMQYNEFDSLNEIRRFQRGETYDPTLTNGEPISALPVLDVVGHVVFQAFSSDARRVGVSPRPREGDLAKKRGVVLNTALEKPQDFPPTDQNLSSLRRNFDRLYRFAITLKNKGRLHPQIAEILHLQ